jgi:Na+-transporting NADH:ubiquinone oxidoreductase subunit NqrC
MGLQFDNSSEFPIVIGPIGAASNAANEVDQIAGATNTSDAFQRILIESYSVYKDLWESIGQ